MILDCGANAECTPEFLLQFGLVGSAYAKNVLGIENPRIGLLNIGTEASKGTALQKEAYGMLKSAGDQGLIHFVGNVEARDVPLGAVDVVVCDGFAGNVLLKSIEGTAMFMGSLMSKMFHRSLISMLAAALVMKDIKGIKKPGITAHGSSDALAFRNAVKQAQDAAQRDFAGELEAVLAQFKAKENENP